MKNKRFGYGETDLFEWVEDNGEMISTKECVKKLNEQQSIIRRDEMSIKTMMSNMKKLEEEKVELMEDCACQYKQIQKLESENEDLREVNKETIQQKQNMGEQNKVVRRK